MARRKVILPNWVNTEDASKSVEMLNEAFEGLTQGELVINTEADNTLLTTLNENGTPVVFESSAMIDKRLEGFLDKVHQHTNKDVLDGITSGMVESWNNAEANAVASSKTYTDDQISFVLCGATEAFDTLKEVEEWINGHSGNTGDILKDINDLKASAHTHSNKALLDTYTQTEANLADAVTKKHEHSNKTVLDGITSAKVTQWDAAEPNVITEISAVTKDNSNVISVNGKKVTIDLTNVGDENVIETIKVNNSALTVSAKTVNVDLSYLEKMIEEIELTPGPKGDDGITPVFTAITANVNSATGTPYVSVTSAKTDGEKYSLAFDFQNLKGEKGDRGDDGTSIKILGTVNSPAEFPENPSNGDGYMLNGHLWVYDGESWIDAGEIKGPQGDPGTNAYITGVTASVSDTTGVPTVKVTTGGTHSEMSIEFDFDNLKGPKGDKGTSITSIGRTGGNGAAGTTDVYTITYSDGTTSTFNVYNGSNGKDGEDGKNGDDGITPVFTAVTASVNNATGTPQVSVVTAKTADEKYSMEFSFQNMKGEKGDKGDDGTSVKILGTKNSYNELPSSNNANGDGYIIGENLYVWNGSTWQDVGKVKGPQGDPGTNAYITGVTATVSNTTGTPSVDVTTAGTPSNIGFNLSFNGLKGQPGEDGKNGEDGVTPVFSSATATISNTTGTPQVTVTSASTGSVYSLKFAFSGLKGADGKDGIGQDGVTPVFSSATATITNTTGTPKVTVTSAATGSVYSLNFAFSGLKGADGTNGIGQDGERGYSYFSTTSSENLSSTSVSIYKSYVNNSGDVRTNDFIVSREGEVFRVTGSTTSYFNLSYVASFRGPQGATGTFDSGELNNYVQKNDADYKNYNAISNIYTKYYNSNGAIISAGTYSAVTHQDTIGIEGKGGIRTDITPVTGIITIDATSAITSALSVVEKNYVQTGDTKYLNTNDFGVIQYHDSESDTILSISATSASDNIFLQGRNGIKLSGTTGMSKSIYIQAPNVVFSSAEDGYATDYHLLGGDGYNIALKKFLSLEPGEYSTFAGGYANVFLDVKTGDTEDSIAVGNHNHDGVYLTEGDLENYDFGTTVSQSTGSSQYFLLGVASKTASTVTKAYVSSTDIYMQGGEIYAASDETLKNFGENIEVDFDKLAEIPKVYYTWKTDADNKQQIGTSAQKLREIYPELVSESEDGKLAVSYEKLSVIALSAVDKLHKENEELKERLRKIEEKLGL